MRALTMLADLRDATRAAATWSATESVDLIDCKNRSIVFCREARTAMLECHMLAAVYRSGAFVVDEIPDPQPRDGQVLVQIEATGICGSDLSAARHTDLFLQSARESGTSLYSFAPEKDLAFGH